MKLFKILLLLFFINITVAQESEFIMCSTEMVNGGNESDSAPCVEYFDYYYDYIDHVQIHKPVFHFVNYDYNVEGFETIFIVNDTIIGMDTIVAPDTITVPFSIPAVQFVCVDDPNHPEYNFENNAFKIAKDLIYWANRTASMLQPSIPGGGVLPNNDFKLRYTDVEDCIDIVIVPNGGAIQNVSGKLNFHIINESNEDFGAMGVMFSDHMTLKNIGNKIIHPNKSFAEWTYGPLMNHEMGHHFGLCHAQSLGNECADIPNDEICASGHVDSNCGKASIACDSGGLNNTMISGAATQRGFTPCQFAEAFPGMLESRAWRTTYLNECQDIIIDNPQETTYIECELYVCSKIIVKTGSELVLRDELIMSQDAEIIVERGARFVMESARIVGDESTPGYWKGIRLTDGFGDQIDINTSIENYTALAPSSFVSLGNIGNNFISDAEVALASRISPVGFLGGTTSLIHLDGVLFKDNEVGISINNYLNNRSVNAFLHNAWFTDNTEDDLIIIAGEDIDIRGCAFGLEGNNGITLFDSELSSFNDCFIQNRTIGMDIMTSYPYHPGFDIGDESGVSNQFKDNHIAIQIGGGIGVGNTKNLDIFRGLFQSGEIEEDMFMDLGVVVLGESGYEISNSSFIDMGFGIISTFSGIAENTIFCNTFSSSPMTAGISTLGNNQNLTMHSNEFDMSSDQSIAIWRLGGDIFQVQSADYDPENINVALNPPAGNQFFDVGFDLNFSTNGNEVDYLIPQPGEGSQYYPQTASNYNTVEAIPDIEVCIEENIINGGAGGSIPDIFVPNDSTDIWPDPIGDPVILNEYLDDLIDMILPGNEEDADGPTRTEIARVRYLLYQWVLHMLDNPDDFDLASIEDFVDDDYRRLLVGYYIHQQDPYNADRILADLSRVEEVNSDFATIQEVNLKRLFPSYYNISPSYIPSNAELQNIRGIAEKFLENTGYASALYYMYTGEKVHPDFEFFTTQPRRSRVNPIKEEIWLNVYPNPTDGHIELSSNKNISEISLYDSYGRIVLKDFIKRAKTHTLDISNHSKGIYFLNIKCGSEIIIKKLVKI